MLLAWCLLSPEHHKAVMQPKLHLMIAHAHIYMTTASEGKDEDVPVPVGQNVDWKRYSVCVCGRDRDKTEGREMGD